MMFKNFARTMVCISLVVAAAPSFAGKIIDDNSGTLHAQENFGGGVVVVSIGNFSSNVTYNAFFSLWKCDSNGKNCFESAFGEAIIPPGQTFRTLPPVSPPLPAPPNHCYYTKISATDGTAFRFKTYCVGP
jgi:hypothetical protein